MASYGMNDVKNGMKILVNNEPSVITDTEYVKPGKGQAFTRVKYRQIRTGRVQEITMKSQFARIVVAAFLLSRCHCQANADAFLLRLR